MKSQNRRNMSLADGSWGLGQDHGTTGAKPPLQTPGRDE